MGFNMKKKIKIFICCCLCLIIPFMLTSCRQATRVSYNIGKQADNFNVCRRLTVINARTDKPMFELVAYFSLSNNSTNELVVTCEVGQCIYKQHYVYLNEWTLYVVEDLSGANVTPYHYEINFLPEMILPFEVISKD